MNRSLLLLLPLLLSLGCTEPSSGQAVADAEPEVAYDEWDVTPSEGSFEPPRDATPSCIALDSAGAPVKTGTPVQAWCAAETTNPATCPGVSPAGGDACDVEGLICRYGLNALGASLARCLGGKWLLDSLACASACPAYTGGTFELAGACGSGPELPCVEHDEITDYARGSQRLRQIADCCGGLNENALVARITDGCVTALAIASPRPENAAFAACLSKLIGGRRLACAKGGCLEVFWSTVK